MTHPKTAPRLLAGPSHFERLNEPIDHPLLERAAAAVEEAAREALASREFEVDPSHHNALLVRARAVQARVITLLVRWHQTHEARYRNGALDEVRRMGEWTDWSWIAMRRGEHGPMADFDLSYGENCATLALAYDWLRETLDATERAALVEIAQTWGVNPYLHHTGRDRPPFWFRAPGNNWNTVCTGGAGMLAIAMHESLEGADEVLERTESSFRPYMEHLDACEGGWAEGVGYWNFGMLYAYRYLLSWSRWQGRRHPLLELEGASRTLAFPLNLTPNGVALGFGDVNRFRPLAFHYAACEALGRTDLYPRLDAAAGENPAGGRGNAAELLLYHPRRVPPAPAPGSRVKRYPTMDWAILGDGDSNPPLHLAIRGGSTQVNHSHLDLMSFNVAVGDEPLLANVGVGEYLDTTFSERRYDLWETRPDAKNTVFVNGVGIKPASEVSMHPIEAAGWAGGGAGGWAGFRVLGAGTFGRMRDGPVAEVCNRAWMLLDGGQVLIVDRFRVPQYARYEARFHTAFEATSVGEASARIDGQRHTLFLRCASSVPASCYRAVSPLTSAEKAPETTMIRWCTTGRFHDAWFATLLSLEPASELEVEALESDQGEVRLACPGGRFTLQFEETLAPISGEWIPAEA